MEHEHAPYLAYALGHTAGTPERKGPQKGTEPFARFIGGIVGKPEEIFKIEAKVKTHRPKAVLFEIHDEEIWIPRSQLIDDEELPEYGDCQVKMTAWIAKEKGLI